jgi:hypothetical protein
MTERVRPANRFRDLTGQTFGRLTVIEKAREKHATVACSGFAHAHAARSL